MSTEVSRRRAWVIAARPQTLPAAAAPVIVGVGLAVHDGAFAPLPALAAFVGAALIQVAPTSRTTTTTRFRARTQTTARGSPASSPAGSSNPEK